MLHTMSTRIPGDYKSGCGRKPYTSGANAPIAPVKVDPCCSVKINFERSFLVQFDIFAPQINFLFYSISLHALHSRMILLFQGCENDIDSMLQESASKILQTVFDLCRHAGELAMATEAVMLSLRDTLDDAILDEEEEEDDNKPRVIN